MYVCRERREGGREVGGGRESTLSVMLDVRGSNMSLSVEAAAVTTDQAGARLFLCAVSRAALTCPESPDGVGMQPTNAVGPASLLVY